MGIDLSLAMDLEAYLYNQLENISCILCGLLMHLGKIKISVPHIKF